MDWLKEQLQSIADWFAGFLNDLLQALIGWFTDAFFFIYDSFLDIFQSIITSIPVPASWASVNPWSGFPPQVYYILDALNIGTCLAIIAAGWGIRFLLNLIPSIFTRI